MAPAAINGIAKSVVYRRSLFGPVDQRRNLEALCTLDNILNAKILEEWEFDFQSGVPKKGSNRWEWMQVGIGDGRVSTADEQNGISAKKLNACTIPLPNISYDSPRANKQNPVDLDEGNSDESCNSPAVSKSSKTSKFSKGRRSSKIGVTPVSTPKKFKRKISRPSRSKVATKLAMLPDSPIKKQSSQSPFLRSSNQQIC